MSYKTVDLRKRLPGSPSSNIGSQAKTPGKYVIHYSGPDFPGNDMYDQLRQGSLSVYQVLENETRGHMTPGRFDPGFTVNGLQYHYTVWEDTVYICRDRNAKLWHCGDGTSPTSYNYSAVAVHVPTTKGFPVSKRTIQTLTEFIGKELKGSSRTLVKGHQEVGASECPGQLMSQFVIPFRANKLNPGTEPPKQGDTDIPTTGRMSRWEFGQVSIYSLQQQDRISITYDGDKLWEYTASERGSPDYVSTPNLSRADFMLRPIEDLPAKFEITYAGEKFGVIERVGDGAPKPDAPKPDKTRPELEYLQKTVGGRYTPWFSGHFKDGVPAWCANTAPPNPLTVRTQGGFCAAMLNLACRVRGLRIFTDTFWWAGGVAWWGERLITNRKVAKPFVLNREYKPGTLFITPYTGAALSQQGHVAILLKGRTLIQSDFGLGINSSRSLDSTYASVSKFTHYIEPEDWMK